jgi:hypothetical protein
MKQRLLVFDSSSEVCRTRVRRLLARAAGGAFRCISIWDLRRLDDLPSFDRRMMVGRILLLGADGAWVEGERAWHEADVWAAESAMEAAGATDWAEFVTA